MVPGIARFGQETPQHRLGGLFREQVEVDLVLDGELRAPEPAQDVRRHFVAPERDRITQEFRVARGIGASDRAGSVLAALRALPDSVADDALVLVHDAARPCVRGADLDRLIAAAQDDATGALLAAPLRDTLKRADANGRVEATVPRADLWRALTPQAFRRGALTRALDRAQADGVAVTDEAMAMERLGLRPLLVEGNEDNIKVTVAADLALAEGILAMQAASA
jgi:2-C-methyl-D-erythritol 4-phosphate cytidylyltransferase